MARNRLTHAGVVPGGGLLERTGNAQCQRGFSMYELLFVVVIVSLVATAMMPSKGPGDSIKLDLVATEIADALRFARSESLRLGLPHGATLKDRHVQLFRLDTATSPGTLVYDVYHPVDRKLYDRPLSKMPFDFTGSISLSPTYRGTCDAIGNVYFDAAGIPWCTDPESVLLEGYKIGLVLGEDSRTVALYGITGRVTIE